MLRKLRALWAKHSTLEAKVQQVRCRANADQLRLGSLKRMQLTVLGKISAIAAGEEIRNHFADSREAA